jgi:hypothetical protein
LREQQRDENDDPDDDALQDERNNRAFTSIALDRVVRFD